MKLIMNVKRFFNRRQPKYGEAIFFQRNWLTKKVDEAILVQRNIHHVTLGEVKEQQ